MEAVVGKTGNGTFHWRRNGLCGCVEATPCKALSKAFSNAAIFGP